MSKVKQDDDFLDLGDIDALPNPDLTPAALAHTDDTNTTEAGSISLEAAFVPQPKHFWGLGLLASLFVTLLAAAFVDWFWRFAASLMESFPIAGYLVTALGALLVLGTMTVLLREIMGLRKLGNAFKSRKQFEAALAAEDLEAAKALALKLRKSAMRRAQWAGLHASADHEDDFEHVFDCHAVLERAEALYLKEADALAAVRIAKAARQIATITAIAPNALIDVCAACWVNFKMIGDVARIYGGHFGMLGSLRLSGMVFGHLVAAGALSLTEDAVSSLGGGMLSKLSRRFGEGLVNASICTRIGLASMETCRPMPFISQRKPKLADVLGKALSGLFGRK